MNNKKKKLKTILCQHKRLAIAFSGGVDSSFLLAFAKQELNSYVVAVTHVSKLMDRSEIKIAETFAKKLGVKHILFKTKILDNKKFTANNKNRCYICKNDIFAKDIEGYKES